MKIVIVSRVPSNFDHPRGGVETATIGLLRGLEAMAMAEIHVVTMERALSRIELSKHLAITVHRLPRTRFPMFLDVFIGPGRSLLRSYIKSLRPDIIHFQETYGLGSYSYPLPTLFTVHGFDSLNLPLEKSWLWQARAGLWGFAERFGLARQSHLISIAPYVSRQIKVSSNTKIYDVRNAIAEGFFNVGRAEVKGRIFFAAWINRRKNASALIKGYLVSSGVRG